MLLIELEWRDLSPVGRSLRAHEGKGLWVHFSNVKKIGFNPGKRQHSDPPGIYLFPLDWLVANAERRESYGSSGTVVHRFFWQSLPHWFVCALRLPPHGADGLVLSQVGWDDLDQWAERFGCAEIVAAWRAGEEKHLVPYWSQDQPGAVLYAALKRKHQNGVPWMRMLRGLRYLYDDVAAISMREPKQIMLFDPSLFRVLDSGTQPGHHGPTDTTDFDRFWRDAISSLVREVAEGYGGRFTWKPAPREKPLPRAEFAVGDRRFTLRVSDRMGVRLSLDYTHGRAKGTLVVESEDLLALSRADLLARLRAMVEGVVARESDLLFAPAMTEGDAKAFLVERVGDGQDNVAWQTEIENEDRVMRLVGRSRHEADGVEFEAMLFASLYEDHVNAGFSVRCAGKPMLDCSTYGSEHDPANLAGLLDALAAPLPRQLADFCAAHDPERERTIYNRAPRMADAAQFRAFRGWCAAQSGIALDGRVERLLADDLAAFRQYPEQRELRTEARYALSLRSY